MFPLPPQAACHGHGIPACKSFESIKTYSTNETSLTSVDINADDPTRDMEKHDLCGQGPSEVVVSPVTVAETSLVTWDGDEDRENPMNWPVRKKVWMSAMASLLSFAVSVPSSIFSGDVAATAKEFDVSEEVMVLGVSLYVLGFACGPLVFGPLSEMYGRVRPMLFGFFCFTLFQVPLAVATNLETILLCRFFAAAVGAAPIACAAGILLDLWEWYPRGIATLVWALTIFSGPALGPSIGDFIVSNPSLNWRWTAWVCLIMAASMLLISLPTASETFAPIVLQRKATRLRLKTQNWALHSQLDEQPIKHRYLIRRYGIRPLQMLLQEPILACITAYMSLVYAIMYLTFVAFPYSYVRGRTWPTGLSSLPFLAVFLGYILGFTYMTLESTYRHRRQTSAIPSPPETRLPPMIVGSIVLVAGLFFFAWTSLPTLNPWPQILSCIFIGFGIFTVFIPGQVYLMDVYGPHASSALAANACVRAALACAFPLVAGPMYDRLGVKWGTSVVGFLCVGLTPFPVVFWVWGKRVRGWSRFVVDAS